MQGTTASLLLGKHTVAACSAACVGVNTPSQIRHRRIPRTTTKTFSHRFVPRFFHWTAPAALTCSGRLPASAETASGLLFASFISLHTDAREMRCFLATSVRDMPEQRSWRTCLRLTSSRARPIWRPSARARAMPLRTRSIKSARSISPSTATMPRNARPSAPDASNASRNDTNWTSHESSSSRT